MKICYFSRKQAWKIEMSVEQMLNVGYDISSKRLEEFNLLSRNSYVKMIPYAHCLKTFSCIGTFIVCSKDFPCTIYEVASESFNCFKIFRKILSGFFSLPLHEV